jgi:RNA polymerase sigma factor (sigma-70 family)
MSGEEELVTLLERHGPAVERGIVIPPELRSVLTTEDVMQEAGLRAARVGERFPRDEAQFRSWLAAVARNACRDLIRSFKAEKRGAGMNRVDNASRGESVFGGSAGTPSGLVRRADRDRHLWKAADSLPDPYRSAAIALLEDATPREVAARLGESMPATYVIIRRAKELLAKALGGQPRDFLSG